MGGGGGIAGHLACTSTPRSRPPFVQAAKSSQQTSVGAIRGRNPGFGIRVFLLDPILECRGVLLPCAHGRLGFCQQRGRIACLARSHQLRVAVLCPTALHVSSAVGQRDRH